MKIIYMGTPDFAVPPLRALLENGYPVSAVVTQPDKPKGRKGDPVPPPVKQLALTAGIPVLQPVKLKEEAFRRTLEGYSPDLIIVAAYGRIIPSDILHLPRLGCINIHASLLPAYRGASPIQHAVIAGEKVSGVTIMQMDEGLDTGDILTQSEIPLAPDETGGSLFDKLAAEGARLLLQTLPHLEDGTLHPLKQPAQSPTPYASMLTKQMGELDFSKPAAELERLIRGLDPWPGAYTFLRGRMLKVWKAAVPETDAADVPLMQYTSPSPGQALNSDEKAYRERRPGTVMAVGREGLYVRCGEGELILTQVQLEGKKRMPAEAFLRGFPVEQGEILQKGD